MEKGGEGYSPPYIRKLTNLDDWAISPEVGAYT